MKYIGQCAAGAPRQDRGQRQPADGGGTGQAGPPVMRCPGPEVVAQALQARAPFTTAIAGRRWPAWPVAEAGNLQAGAGQRCRPLHNVHCPRQQSQGSARIARPIGLARPCPHYAAATRQHKWRAAPVG